MTTLRYLLLAALCAFAVATPSARASTQPPPPPTATQAVFAAYGRLDAEAEIALILSQPNQPRSRTFREMAGSNLALAERFADAPVFAAYLMGRASAFLAVAELLGE